MLDAYNSQPTIKNAIMKRLELERGVEICDIPIKVHPDNIAVGVLALLDKALIVRSRFDLPPEFEIGHLHNEIDEIAEQYKAARMDYWGRGHVLRDPEMQLAGTGLRGRWKKHA